MTVTASLMIAVYAIVNGNEVGWATPGPSVSSQPQARSWGC